MSLNKILSLAASIIKSTILFFFIFFHSNISSEEMTKYNPEIIEKKWQKYWAEKRVYISKADQTKKKFYVLEMFPYHS